MKSSIVWRYDEDIAFRVEDKEDNIRRPGTHTVPGLLILSLATT